MKQILLGLKWGMVGIGVIIVILLVIIGTIILGIMRSRNTSTPHTPKETLNYQVDPKFNYTLSIVAENVGQITRMKITPDGQIMFVATLRGDIIVFHKKDGIFVKQESLFYSVDTQLEGFPRENGLTGFTFAGDYETSKEIFLSYTTLNEKKEIKNRVARITQTTNGDQVVGINFSVIFEGNVTPTQAHQIQGGAGVTINKKSYFMFPVGDAFESKNAHDLTKDAGKIMLIQRDGSNPEGVRPYPDHPKVQAIGVRNSYDITVNPYDDFVRYLFDDTGNINNDKLMYGKLMANDVNSSKKLDLRWNGDDASQLLGIEDPLVKGTPNMNLFQWSPTATPLDIQFIKGGVGNIGSSNKNTSYFLITLFGQTGSLNTVPGKEILLGKLTNLDSQPKVELVPFITRSENGGKVQGNPIGLAEDPETHAIYFGDIIEGRIYKASAIK